jgi:uncharacterized protein GlcG (DUF336 family)
MTQLSLEKAKIIIGAAFEKGAELDLKPLSVIVLDAGGHVKAFERQDGASNLRFGIAHGKAYGGLGFGVGSRALYNRAEQQHYFVTAYNGVAGGAVVPVPGGALVKNQEGEILGAVGVTGDTSDNDEICLVHGIEAAGFVAQVD